MNPRHVLQLTRWKVSLLAAVSALTGAASFSVGYALSASILVPTAGTLLLAMGASALNQVQEREIDARMVRTRGRPIPAGKVSPPAAAVLGLATLVGGGSLLVLGAGWTVAALGGAAVLWYNGIYTYLKRVSAFAAVPGALVGALPPLIGWASAGGHPADPRALALATVFLLWQVPHFWLLLLRWGPDYERAGLPSLTAIFGPGQLSRITMSWLIASGAVSALLPLFELGPARWAPLCPGLGPTLAAVAGAGLFFLGPRRFPRLAFHAVNAYLVTMMVLLTLDRVLRWA